MTKHFREGFMGRAGGCYTCNCCGKKTRETGDGESDCELCRRCFRESGWENTHSDEAHGGDKVGCEKCAAMGYTVSWMEA